MATKTTMTKPVTTKPRAKPKNTSAPTAPETRAEVSAQGEASASPGAGFQLHVEGAKLNLAEGSTPPQGAGDDGHAVKAIRVVASHDGFRRGGRAWSTSPTTVSVDEFTPEQLAAIETEPLLDVAYVADKGGA